MNRFIDIIAGIAFLQVLVNAQPSPDDYDFGCEKLRNELLYSNESDQSWAPTCVDGGMWKNVQCTSVRCYCAYGDTGEEFDAGLGSFTSLWEAYIRMNMFCPRRISSTADGCIHSPVTYPCYVDEPKYVFNVTSLSCEMTSIGCHGYPTLSDCNDACVLEDACNTDFDEGQTCANGTEDTRFGYDATIEDCSPFQYLGCGGNFNNYMSLWECQKSCVSQLVNDVMIQVGSHVMYTADLPRWIMTKHDLDEDYMNDVTEGAFEEIEEYADSITMVITTLAETTTGPPMDNGGGISDNEDTSQYERRIYPRDHICSQPVKIGFCRGYFFRWHYDEHESLCVDFIYGGCQGNGNNFRTFDECKEFCIDAKSTSSVKKPIIPGEGVGLVEPIVPR